MMNRNDYQHPEEVRIILKYWFYSRLSGCMGLLLLFVTLITPNWIRVTSSLSRISLGLWSICIDINCRIVTEHSIILDICRALLSTSTICGLVAVSASLISNPTLRQSKWPLITNLATAFISLLAIVLFSLSVADKISIIDDEEEKDFRYFLSFSFVGSCLGCFFFFLSGAFFILIKIKESAIIFPVSHQVSPKRTKKVVSVEKEIDVSVDGSDSGIACAYGVM